MQKIVFYSWQSDLPNSTNRGFIESALNKAASTLTKDESIEVEPVIERDTKGLAGAPDIPKAILEKIEAADIFVADVSIITPKGAERPIPNPNVLIELGYALKTLGPDRVVLVMNKAFGGPEFLPFDLKMKRVIVYELAESSNKAEAKKVLEDGFEGQMRLIFETLPSLSKELTLEEKVIVAIESESRTRVGLLKQYWKKQFEELEKLYPGPYRKEDDDEALVQSLEKTRNIVFSFGKIAETIADSEDSDSLRQLFSGFKPLLECYYLPVAYSGQFSKADHDFYRFIGNELLVTIVSVFLKEKKWDLLKIILEERIVIDNAYGQRREAVGFTYFSKDTPGLDHRNQRLELRRVSIRADILKERHTTEPINQVSLGDDYFEADFFLYLGAEAIHTIQGREAIFEWIPWTSIYLGSSYTTPRFLVLAQSKKIAEKMAETLGLSDLPQLKELVQKRSSNLEKLWQRRSFWDNPLNQKEIEKIGMLN